MILKIFKILLLIILAYIVFTFIAKDGSQWTHFKLYRMLLTRSLDEIRNDYAAKDCLNFSAEEKKADYFEAFVTGYCKPKAADFDTRQQFLCSVALNCSCPNGKTKTTDCSSNSLRWQGCSDFNEQTNDYCHQTASELKPEAGHVAAEWKCFAKNSAVEIDGKPYKVTDKGGIIKGRRFDIWFENCTEAEKTTGIYKVKIPK